MTAFQQTVNVQPAPAVAGDFCDTNPRFSVDAGPGGLVAGPNGVTVGRFAWATNPDDGDGFPSQVSNSGSGPVTGFVHREQQGLITTYLAESGLLVPQGFGVTLFSGGGFWVKNDGATEAVPGQKAYANVLDGKVTFAATGSPAAGGTSTASSIAASTFAVTGSITDEILTVTAVGSGTVVPGATISGTGVATGTKVLSQQLPLLAGEAVGGIGRYVCSISEQTVASTAVSGTYGTLTIGGTVAGTFAVNNTISGTSVVAGTTITALGTGTGGAGTYVVDNNTVVSSTAINVAASQVETKWVCMSSGLAGELVKISDHVLG